MSDDWLKKCKIAASLPLGDLSAFEEPDSTAPATTDRDRTTQASAQGIEIGWTDEHIVLVLRSPGDQPKLIKLTTEDAITVAENLKKASMLLMFKNSLKGSGRSSRGSSRGSDDSGPSDDSEPEPV